MPPRKVLTKLHPGLRFVVRLVFKRDPGRNSQPVTLRQAKGGASIRLTAKWVKRANVFRTGVVRLTGKARRWKRGRMTKKGTLDNLEKLETQLDDRFRYHPC